MNRSGSVKWTGILLALAFLGLSCSSNPKGPAQESSQPGPKKVFVVNYPLEYFARRIGGGAVKVVFPLQTEEDPAFWLPEQNVVVEYQQADLILCNGATYAKWLDKVSLPLSKMVDTAEAFKDRYLEVQDPVTHSHGPGGMHSHTGVDFNTWLDPLQAIQQANAVRQALAKLVPEKASVMEAGFESLKKDLEALDAALRAVSTKADERPLMASHPVYNYLARRYKWRLKSLHWEPSEMPSEEEWKKLGGMLKDHPAKFMIWEDQPDAPIAERLKKDHGLECIVFRPCGNRPPRGDYLSEMKANFDRLKAAFTGP